MFQIIRHDTFLVIKPRGLGRWVRVRVRVKVREKVRVRFRVLGH